MESEKTTKVKFGRLDELYLADVNLYSVRQYPPIFMGLVVKKDRSTYILERIDALGRLFDLTADDFRNQFGDQLGQSAACRLA